MDYFDLIRDICNEHNLNSGIWEDGDNEGEYVLVVESSKDLAELNSLLKEKFEELGVDTSEVYRPDDDESYVEFATEGKWEYYEEVYVCDNCYKVFRIEQYGYTNYFCGNGFILCPDCMKEEPETYLETLINNYRNANTLLTGEELEKLGFEQIGEEYENGWYGRSDNPKEILDKILAEEPDAEIVFDITKTYNPFATRFTTYIRRQKGE